VLLQIFSSACLAATDFSKKTILLGRKTVTVEVAETQDQLQRGLMFRTLLNDNEGMLFVFKNEETRFFWMKNTFLDLSIGFFDKNKVLVDVQDMKSGKDVNEPLLPSYGSAKPAMYALEMNMGWFDKNKIKMGSRFKYQ
jgi:hypothetical protein